MALWTWHQGHIHEASAEPCLAVFRCCVHINGTESVHPVLLRTGKSTERNERLCGIGDISTSEQWS